jgi:hypothetical protein
MKQRNCRQDRIEFMVVFLLFGLLISIAVPGIKNIEFNSRYKMTFEEMCIIRDAICGRPDLKIAGSVIIKGYEGDVGFAPPEIKALFEKPSDVPLWSPVTKKGWNGPYLISESQDFLHDAWGEKYVYSAQARSIKSINPSGEIIVRF